MPVAGNRLRTLREAANLTQKELADALSVSVRSVQAWEAGTSVPQARHRRRLAEFFSVSEDRPDARHPKREGAGAPRCTSIQSARGPPANGRHPRSSRRKNESAESAEGLRVCRGLSACGCRSRNCGRDARLGQQGGRSPSGSRAHRISWVTAASPARETKRKARIPPEPRWRRSKHAPIRPTTSRSRRRSTPSRLGIVSTVRAVRARTTPGSGRWPGRAQRTTRTSSHSAAPTTPPPAALPPSRSTRAVSSRSARSGSALQAAVSGGRTTRSPETARAGRSSPAPSRRTRSARSPMTGGVSTPERASPTPRAIPRPAWACTSRPTGATRGRSWPRRSPNHYDLAGHGPERDLHGERLPGSRNQRHRGRPDESEPPLCVVFTRRSGHQLGYRRPTTDPPAPRPPFWPVQVDGRRRDVHLHLGRRRRLPRRYVTAPNPKATIRGVNEVALDPGLQRDDEQDRLRGRRSARVAFARKRRRLALDRWRRDLGADQDRAASAK